MDYKEKLKSELWLLENNKPITEKQLLYTNTILLIAIAEKLDDLRDCVIAVEHSVGELIPSITGRW